MNLPFFIARRYFFSRRVSGVVHIISGISLTGITVCSFALIVILSVFNGFQETVSKLYNVFDSDLKIIPDKGKYFDLSKAKTDAIKKLPNVIAVTPVIEENALLKYKDKQTIASFKSIDPPYLRSMHIDSMIEQGDAVIRDGERSYTLVGTGVAAKLSLPGRDDFNPLQVFVPKRGEISFLNPESAFNKRSISVSGKFSIVQEFDEKYIILPLSFARMLEEQPTAMTAFELKTGKDADIEKIRSRVKAIIGPGFRVLDRFEQQPTTFKVMKSEKFFVYMMLSFIMVIAAFNMIGALLMLAIDKKQDMMAILSMGGTEEMLRSILFYEGLMLSIIGGVAGIILGGIVGFLQKQYGFIKISGAGDSSTFVLNAYPVAFKPTDFLLVFITVIVLGFAASWYPARVANKRLSIRDLRE
jgi:lipoprotein-releasing system permease protein